MCWEGSLNWATIVKQILDDPVRFINEGGWKSLDEPSSEKDSDSDSNDDQSFHAPVDEEIVSSDSEYSEEGGALAEEDMEDSEEYGSDEEELSEEGLSWDEHERRAAIGKDSSLPW